MSMMQTIRKELANEAKVTFLDYYANKEDATKKLQAQGKGDLVNKLETVMKSATEQNSHLSENTRHIPVRSSRRSEMMNEEEIENRAKNIASHKYSNEPSYVESNRSPMAEMITRVQQSDAEKERRNHIAKEHFDNYMKTNPVRDEDFDFDMDRDRLIEEGYRKYSEKNPINYNVKPSDLPKAKKPYNPNVSRKASDGSSSKQIADEFLLD